MRRMPKKSGGYDGRVEGQKNTGDIFDALGRSNFNDAFYPRAA